MGKYGVCVCVQSEGKMGKYRAGQSSKTRPRPIPSHSLFG